MTEVGVEINQIETEEKIKLLEKIARINASEIFDKRDSLNVSKEICGLMSEQGVEFDDPKCWGKVKSLNTNHLKNFGS